MLVFGEEETEEVIVLSTASSKRTEKRMCDLGSSGSNIII